MGLFQEEYVKKIGIIVGCLVWSACASLKTSSEYVARGNGYLKDGKRQQAIAAYNKAISLNNHNMEAYQSRAAAYFFDGQYELAAADFEHVLQADPYQVSVYTAYASVLAAQGDFEQALTLLNLAAQLKPGIAETYFARAGVYFMLGQYEPAVADYTRTLQIRPAADVFNARGIAYEKWGKPNLARQDFEFAQKANIPPHINSYAGLD